MFRTDPLAGFSLIDTNFVEEAEFKLSQTITDLQINRIVNRGKFRLEMNAVTFGRTSLVFNRFGSGIELKTSMPAESAIFVIGGNVPSRFTTENKKVVVSSQKAAMVAPAREISVERPQNSELLVLRVSMADLIRHFEKLTNKRSKAPLVFDSSIGLKQGSGAMLKSLLNYLVCELEHNDFTLKSPSLKKAYDDMRMTALLSLPHNQMERLNEGRSHYAAPGLVRRAEEYMQAHLNENITIIDLLQISNCSRNALFAAFQSFRGYAPMEFLTKQRLQNARERLLQPFPEDSVTSIAFNSGFNHLGRFSQMYRKRFGEVPSDTLRKGKEAE
jgi:AraC-like DNA-binding protein